MDTQTEVKKSKGLKLVIDAENRVVQDATVPIRWVLSKEISKELARKKAKYGDPHLLLFVVANRKEVSRELIPLSQKAHYVQLHKAGNNTIFAKIVWGDYKELWNRFLKRYGSWYDTDIVDHNGTPCLSDHYIIDEHSSEAELDIEVPEGLFADEPPEWLKWWVNLWFKGAPIDQCHFRKRMTVAFTIQPIVVLFQIPTIILVRSCVIAFLLICGMRNINFSPLFHPFRDDTDEIMYEVSANNSIFLKRPECSGSDPELYFWSSFHPAFWIISLILAGIAMIADYFPSDGTSLLLATVIIAATIPIIFMALEILYSLLMLIANLVPSSIMENWEKAAERRRKEREQRELELRNEFFSELTLNGKSNVMPPARHRSIKLHFESLKARVCRPYAK